MPDEFLISLNGIKIGSYTTMLSVCRDGYSLSNSPVPGIETSDVLARINESQPLTSSDGSYQNEILRSVFNIGLKNADLRPVWITPNSIRHGRHNPLEKDKRKSITLLMSSNEFILHRQFASLIDKQDKDILSFANRYGLLKRHSAHNLVFKDKYSGQQVQLGESLLWWQEEINDLASRLKLWDMVLSDHKELKNIVLWHRDGIALRLNGDYLHLVSRKNMNLLSKWHRGDLRGPASYYISLEIEKRLLNTLTPRIPDMRSHEIYFYPDSLLSAIWLMFLLEISGETRLLRCSICGEYFNTHDPRAQFCSVRCRMRKYRSSQSSKALKKKIKGGKKL